LAVAGCIIGPTGRLFTILGGHLDGQVDKYLRDSIHAFGS
jgi:hypothetical protein